MGFGFFFSHINLCVLGFKGIFCRINFGRIRKNKIPKCYTKILGFGGFFSHINLCVLGFKGISEATHYCLLKNPKHTNLRVKPLNIFFAMYRIDGSNRRKSDNDKV